MNRGSNILKIALAWLPFGLFWMLILMMYTERGPLAAALSGLIVIGGAAVLGIGVWWFSGVYSWPEKLRPTFYAVHLVVGTGYAVVWTMVDVTSHAFQERANPFVMLLESPVLAWQLMMGLMFYGLIAGVSYSVRTRGRLRDQEKIAARAEALAAQAQLQTLRAQLNPHFLFNALHSFSTLVRHDPEAAERAVERLGDLLRYALDEGEGEVPLGDEWTFTRHYLELERLRLDSRLRVDTQFEPDAFECLVPSFTLQPLVENAIQHAIAPRPEGGTVIIGARLEEDRLIVHVGDDGPGDGTGESGDGRGLGLRMLRQRLQALYGKAAELSIDTAAGKGFSATVSLPRRLERELVRNGA